MSTTHGAITVDPQGASVVVDILDAQTGASLGTARTAASGSGSTALPATISSSHAFYVPRRHAYTLVVTLNDVEIRREEVHVGDQAAHDQTIVLDTEDLDLGDASTALGGAGGGFSPAAAPAVFEQGTTGGFASGYAQSSGSVSSTGTGAAAFGYATGAGSAITASGQGTVAVGQARSAGTIEASDGGGLGGAFAGGEANGGGSITASNDGAFAFGDVTSQGVIAAVHPSAFVTGAANGNGSELNGNGYGACFVHGYARAGGKITASGYACAIAFGYANGAGSTINSSDYGSFANGHAKAAGEITASDQGAFAMGVANVNAVTASGKASFAFGDSTAGAVVASATNAAQFGPGTNSQADSLAVGTTMRLKGTTGAPGTPRNGDMWVANNYVYIRSNGVSKKIT